MARVYTAALLRLKGADKSPVGLLRPDSDSVDVGSRLSFLLTARGRQVT